MKDYNNSLYPFQLQNLPYQSNALEPYISSNTLSFHYGKHHNTYIANLNHIIKDTPFINLTLEQIILKTYGDANNTALFNNAAQVWNHTFFWHSMCNSNSKPSALLLSQIEKNFGNYDKFIEEFSKMAIAQFGSGWAWLVWDKKEEQLLITKTNNADLPMCHGQHALLTIDVWEHAYYLDYQNRRADYVNTILRNIINWQFAESNFAERFANQQKEA